MLIYYHHRTLGDGAEGIHIREMIAAFRQLGHTVKVFGLVGEGPAVATGRAGWLIRLKRALPGAVFELCEMGYTLVSFWQLWRAIKKERPSFIYDRYITFNAGPVLAGKFTGVPIFLEVNAPLALERSEEADEKLIFRRVAFAVEKWICSHASKTIVVSTPLKEYLESVGVAKGQCLVLPNGVNPTRFSPRPKNIDLLAELGIPNNSFVIGFTGVLRPWHGLDFLVTAFNDLVNSGKKVRLLIVGDGPHRSYLERMAIDFRLKDLVTITGKVPHEKVPDYVSLFDVAVSPKATFYASPMKVVEYMALEKPVVVPRLKNFQDIIVDGFSGLAFEEDNIYSFNEAINVLVDSPSLANKIGKEARTMVEGRLNWKWNGEKVCSLI